MDELTSVTSVKARYFFRDRNVSAHAENEKLFGVVRITTGK